MAFSSFALVWSIFFRNVLEKEKCFFFIFGPSSGQMLLSDVFKDGTILMAI